MEVPESAKMPARAEPATSLSEVLEQSEHVKDVLQECANDMLSVDEDLRQELADRGPRARVENALEKNQGIQSEMQDASTKLSVVNRALAVEVRDRELVDHQFAASVEQEEAARIAAGHDVLTGLPNRALFRERLEHGFGLARRRGWVMAVMFIDLDGFKAVNDAHGHEAGDAVLQIIARRLEKSARLEDTVSRHGGDEFLYLAADAQDENNMVMLANKLIHAIQTPCEVYVGNTNISPTINASIGISLFPRDGTTADALIEGADRAMYRAKQKKSGYSFAGQPS